MSTGPTLFRLQPPRSLEELGRLPLEELLRRARGVTDAVFGHSILLYAPCYLSSFCVNHCRYCGFSFRMPIPRRCLSPDEALEEIALLAGRGFKRILLVAGEYPARVSQDYVAEVLARARPLVPEIDLEIGPARVEAYGAWVRAGAGGVTCYQETYDEAAYADLHPRGPKAFFGFRLGTLERAGEGGVRRLGLGILLGLADPIPDLMALVAHARLMGRLFPEALLTVSLPRLRPAVPGFRPAWGVGDDDLLRFYAVLRLALPRAGLVVSTREPADLRRRLLRAGITQMSAGSVTVPGGYAGRQQGGGQFEIADHRGVGEVRRDLEDLGYSVRWT